MCFSSTRTSTSYCNSTSLCEMAAQRVSAPARQRSLLHTAVVLALCLLSAGVIGEARKVSEDSLNLKENVIISQKNTPVSKRRELQTSQGVAYYCVAKPNADTSKLQDALDWTCGAGSSLGSVDCSAIQEGGSCYDPDTVADHASYAFTLYYYHQSAASHACDFKGLATLTTTNPSSGTCVYPTSPTSTSTSSPSNPSPPIPPSGSTTSPFFNSPAPSPNEAPSQTLFLASSQLLCLLPLLLLL